MEKKSIINIAIFIVIGIIVGAFIPLNTHQMTMSMDMKRDSFINLRQSIQADQLVHSKYRCCLEKPCIYCIEKTPGHGEGAECSCQEDIYNGVHPCGECIGEILEGHGNPLMSEYFARAIAEKTGQYDAIRQIISEKYNITIEQQL